MSANSNFTFTTTRSQDHSLASPFVGGLKGWEAGIYGENKGIMSIGMLQAQFSLYGKQKPYCVNVLEFSKKIREWKHFMLIFSIYD